MMKQKSIFLFFLAFFFFCSSGSLHAQYWGVWHKTHNITLGLSTDEKWAFFIKKNDAGVDNIYKIELKTNTVSPVTNFNERPVVSGIVLFGKPAVVYARAATTKGDDIHLYRVNVLTNDEPVDFTSKDASSNKKILGMADNGRYVYYLSDRGPNTHTDTYRYDTQQYIIELAFANDKDYETLCWSHDQTHLLLRDPKTRKIFNYDIETTNKQEIGVDMTAADVKTVFYSPMNEGFYLIDNVGNLTFHNISNSDAVNFVHLGDGKAIDNANLSLKGKFIHVISGDKERIIQPFLELPVGAFDLIIGPKEASVLYANIDGNATKLYLYDIGKKTTKELTTIR